MLIGRVPELDLIAALLESAAAGAGGVLALRGEAGIGKTALLDEATRRANGFRVLRAAGSQSEAELAYATLHQLLRPLLDRVDSLPTPQARALGSALGTEAGHEPDRLLVGLAVLTLLAEATEEQPLLCLVDDVQWIDGESLDALAFAIRRLQSERLAIVCAVRDTNGSQATLTGAQELLLQPLNREQATQLLTARHGERLDSTRESVLTRAAGNPLALVELADAAVAGEAAATTVEQTYANASRRLPPDAQTLLLLAATCEGGVWAVSAAATVVGLDIAALEPAELAGLVRVEEQAIVFKHPLVRSAVYGAATFAQRRRAHSAFAEILRDDEGDRDRYAWHRAAATIGDDDEVADLLVASASRAISRGGYVAAASALERAARLSSSEAVRAQRLVEAASAACNAGQRARAIALLDEADAAIDDVRVRIEAARVRGVIESQHGSPAAATRIFLDAAADAYALDRRQALHLVTWAQETAGLAGANDALLEFEAWTERFDEVETTEEEIMLGLVHGFARIAAGDRAGAAPALARAAELGTGVDEPRLLVWSATAATFLGDDLRALELLRRAVSHARARGAFGLLPFALHLLADVERRLGDIAGAEADADESRRLAVESGQAVVTAGALSTLTALAAFRGDVARAEQLAAETRALAQPRGLPVALADAARAIAELDLARGRAADALAALLDAVGETDGRARNHPYALFSAPLIVEAAARAGRAEEALPYLEAFEQWTEAGALAWARPLAARGRALLATGDAGREEWYSRSLELHRVQRQPYETARTQLLYGEYLRRARRKSEARTQLRSAVETFQSLGARIWAERALGELRATGATARRRDDSSRDDLTPQELQIVRLVAIGKTNPEVAGELFVSPKTVQYHLRKVFGKLGIASRVELTRLVARGEIAGAVAIDA
jgi:DNA-binding CsgD family transcriptional regulator/tetratricopeptide (TPR) repeat protein